MKIDKKKNLIKLSKRGTFEYAMDAIIVQFVKKEKDVYLLYAVTMGPSEIIAVGRDIRFIRICETKKMDEMIQSMKEAHNTVHFFSSENAFFEIWEYNAAALTRHIYKNGKEVENIAWDADVIDLNEKDIMTK